MILSAQSIIANVDAFQMISPFEKFEVIYEGTSYGLGPAGYSVRIATDLKMPPRSTVLASTIERFQMPDHLKAKVCDKSSWARKFLSVMNTSIQPGWHGYLTLELENRSAFEIVFKRGMAIAEIEFHKLDAPTLRPYRGVYQNQEAGPKDANMERQNGRDKSHL